MPWSGSRLDAPSFASFTPPLAPRDDAAASGVAIVESASASGTLTTLHQPVSAGSFTASKAKFTFSGGRPTPFPAQNWTLFPVSSIAPATSGGLSGYLTGNPDYTAWDWEVSFETEAPALEIQMLATGTNYKYAVLVDGKFATAVTGVTPGASGTRYVNIDFAAVRKARRIQFVSTGPNGFGRVATTAIDTIRPVGGRKLVAFSTGDSYSEGIGLASPRDPNLAWNRVMAGLLGVTDLRQVAVGSTGYLQTGGTRSKIRDQIPKWLEINNDVTPDLIFCAAGTNDADSFTAAAIGAEALLAWGAMRVAYPSATIVVFGPWGQDSGPSASRTALETELQARFAQWGDANSYFVPTNNGADGAWMFGTGRVGATTGTGNADWSVNNDSVHPSDAGHEYLGRRGASAVRQLPIW